MSFKEGEIVWEASEAKKRASNVARFMDWLRLERGLDFESFEALRAWSADDIEAFWATIWDHYEILSDVPLTTVLESRMMPGAKWFPGTKVNFAEHVLRHEAKAPDKTVFHHLSEIRGEGAMSWSELGDQVRTFATALRALGVGPGDAVVAFMPNIPETMVAMLAVTAIGGIWSSAAPEFGEQTVIDRFGQISPKVLLAVDGYRFGGRDFSRVDVVGRIAQALPELQTIVWLEYLGGQTRPTRAAPQIVDWARLMSATPKPREAFEYARVGPEHPLWVLFTSGTTGLPKAIVHNHHGILVEFYKTAALHIDLKPDSCMFFYSTTGWMMWNSLVWAPMLGGRSVLYDGSPSHPGPERLWQMAERFGVTCFGTSPSFIEQMRRTGVVPGELFDLSAITNIFLAGSPATVATFEWLYDTVKSDLWVTTQSGGTEFCSGILVASMLLPVRAAEIQTRGLGVDLRVFDDSGNELVDDVGELVITKPMPSMPIFLWGDSGYRRYSDAYFDVWPGMWRHGDFVRLTAHGGCQVLGRSDATMNRHGVRIGTAEVYNTLDHIETIADCLICCIEEPDGGFYMPLFVVPKQGHSLDDDLRDQIVKRLRQERSPRHVPDEIFSVPSIPYTSTGKRMEIPVRKILMGFPPARAFSRDVMRDPGAMDWFLDFATQRLNTAQGGLYSKISRETRD